MLRKVISQLAFVNGKGIGNVTLANDAATSSTQGEMDLSSLLRLCIADFPNLFLERIKSNQGFFTTSNFDVERRKALLLLANFFFCPV